MREAKSFEAETLKYFNDAQNILSCGRRYKNNSYSEYKNCILSLKIHQKYQNDLLTFTLNDFASEFRFKEAIEVGAFNFCNSFPKSSSADSDLINSQVLGGAKFDFYENYSENEHFNVDFSSGKGKKDGNLANVKGKDILNEELGIKYQKNNILIGLISLILIIIICYSTYFIVSKIRKSDKALSQPSQLQSQSQSPESQQHFSYNYSPYNYLHPQSHLNSQIPNFTDALPPSYEEVNRPFRSFSGDKIPYQNVKN